MIRRLVFFILISMLGIYGPATAHASQDPPRSHAAHVSHQTAEDEDPLHIHTPMTQQPETPKNVGVDEHLGGHIPLDASFKDEDGRNFRMGDFLTRPTILLPVFFHCPMSCNLMLGSLASALTELPMAPGESYRVLAMSFDDEEGPDIAKESKRNYFNILSKGFPENHWRFITGDIHNITAVTQALGYRFQKQGEHVFIHPNALVVLAPDGKIIRYLYGVQFLPFDLGMAITEAAEGTPQLSIRKVLSFCFAYDPKQKTYVFKTFQIYAIGTFCLLFAFFWFFLRKGNKQ